MKGKKEIMKKIAGFVLALASVASLASCGGGNAAGEKSAVDKTLKASICTVFASGNPLMADVESELSGTSNDALSVTTKQITPVDGNKYTVDISWSWAEEFNERIKLVDLEGDETHKKMEFVYPETGKEAVSLSFKAKAVCGSANGEATFLVKLVPPSTIYDEVKIGDIYKLNAAGDNFEMIGSDGKIKPNHGQAYYYVAVSGKLIYKSPDSNWGLLADGSDVIELYHLDMSSDNDKAVVGKYLTIYADVSNGYGNIQLAYLNKIEEMADHSKIAEPTEHVLMKAGVNDSTSADYKKFYEDHYMNSLGYVEGTYVAGPGAFNPGARWTFGLKVDSTHTITVAYDYHVAKGDDAVKNAYKAIIDAATSSTKIRVKGTVRWATDDGKNTIGGAGKWTITPYLAGDMEVVA